MAWPGDEQRAHPTAAPAVWNAAQRQAALDALAQQFHMTITEAEVFQAATLFFALLREGAFVEQGRIAARMQEDLLRAQAPESEAGRPL